LCSQYPSISTKLGIVVRCIILSGNLVEVSTIDHIFVSIQNGWNVVVDNPKYLMLVFEKLKMDVEISATIPT
jgi:hypothetical protein